MKTKFSVPKVAAEPGVSPKPSIAPSIATAWSSLPHKKYILDYIHANYPEIAAPAQTEIHAKIITVVVQKKPKFFWQPTINEMQNAISAYPQDSICPRTVCFSGTRNDTKLRTILSQIPPKNTDGLIVVPINSKSYLQTMRKTADQFPVVILDDYFDYDDQISAYSDNFFYVHGDGKPEGAEVADLVAMSAPKEKNILILHIPFRS